MKLKLEALIQHAVQTLKNEGVISAETTLAIVIERCKDSQHGDFACNVAMVLAKQANMNPRQLAEKLVAALPNNSAVINVEIAGPGFINFFIDASSQYDIIKLIHAQGSEFGHSQIGAGKKVQVEFVSANPTGPLHVGHGRGAAYGSAVADLLVAAGFNVHREYYVNDAGRQMDILATSVWLRYLEKCGEPVRFPDNGYRGAYVSDIAKALHQQHGDRFRHVFATVIDAVPADESQGGDKEAHIDGLIAKAKTLLGVTGYREVFAIGLDDILGDIRNDLMEFGVNYEEWFSEQSLVDNGAVDQALARLQQSGHLYEKDGAVWFASSALGDEKDRVVKRENGQYTYFASDIAYHMHKLDRGFDQIIDIWGADHHGYIPRVKAAIQALGADANKLKVLLVQFATLYRGEEKVQMSTRSGEFVTLRQLRNEVGKDAARFFYVMRKSEQHMDFDLQLATSKTSENPVYYVQYAHARVCSVFRQLTEKGFARDLNLGMASLNLLTEDHETHLIATLTRYPEVIERAALAYEPHQLISYLRSLANDFHTYYNAHQFLVDDTERRNARLNLIDAVKQVLANGLKLLSINTPETM